MSPGGWLAVAVLLGLIPASIARRKGDSFGWWWLFGAALFPVALVVAVVMKDGRPRCPWCDEAVSERATVCPRCRREIPQPAGPLPV